VAHEPVVFNPPRRLGPLQLQLSLTLADDLYESLLLEGEPFAHEDAARHILALQRAPADLCGQIMRSLVAEDPRFSWHEGGRIGLAEWSAKDPDLAEVSFVVVDLETTGSRPGPCKITEIGAVRIEDLGVSASFHSLINPRRPIPPAITKLTGITSDMVREAPPIEHVLPGFLSFAEGAIVVAHNAPFDLAFLNYELGRTRGRRIGEGAFDTVRMSRRLAPGLPNHRLGTVAGAFGFPGVTFHRALADAEATAHVFLALIGRLQERDITTLQAARAFINPSPSMRLRQLVSGDIPRRPGTYRFVGKDGTVLYVGKADQLRNRIRSYFVPSAAHSRRIRQALRHAESVVWEEADTPLEAVVREQEQILEYRPAGNVRGRRPESYVYLKALASAGTLRLQTSRRPGPTPAGKGGAAHVGAPGTVTLGPFRGPARVKNAVDLLRRCYPLARCTRTTAPNSCIYLHTGRCLAPCNGDPKATERHNHLVADLLAWVAGSSTAHTVDPLAEGQASMHRLSRALRFEEAERVRAAIDDLAALQKSYQALAEAAEIHFAALFPLRASASSQPEYIRVNIVWGGVLLRAFTVSAATAPLEVGRAVRGLPPARRPGPFLSVAPEEVDTLLAVRRWTLDSPGCDIIHSPQPEEAEATRREWASAVVRRSLELLTGHA